MASNVLDISHDASHSSLEHRAERMYMLTRIMEKQLAGERQAKEKGSRLWLANSPLPNINFWKKERCQLESSIPSLPHASVRISDINILQHTTA